MFCTKCGNKLVNGEKFCTSCGNKVEALPDWNSDKTEIASPVPQNNGNERIGLLFDEREPSFNNAVSAPKTEPAAEQETEIAPPVQVDMPYVMPDTSDLITNTEYLRALAEPSVTEPPVVPSGIDLSDEESVIMESDEEPTLIDSEADNTVVAQPDDSYNVYSGAVPGVSSQDFRYPTNDNAYPDLPTSIAPQFDEMAQQFDGEDATVVMDYPPRAQVNQVFETQQAAPQQSYMHQGYGNYAENFPYPPQNNYNNTPEEPKKKNTAMWIIIACISVIIVAVGATCAVILTQYGSFEDFFASFSDSEDDEEDNDESEGKKDKGDEETEDEEKTEIRTTESTTEATTVEITTLPSTTQQPFDGYCGSQVYYDYDESRKTLVISGTGEMQNYANIVTPWAGKDVKRVEVGEGVTSVTPGAFTEIVPDVIYLSSTVTSFDVLAVNKFGGIEVSPSNKQYKSINEVLFDKSGTILIAYPNRNVNTSYAIPEGVKIISELAFYEATNLNSLSISSTVEYIDNYAFKGCVNIHRLDLPENVTEIRSGVFYGWVDSQEIYIANAETKVVSDWNEGCSAEITVLS